ncbi:MAG: NAD-dependent epimerase/dehydratase family protein [Gammaproteobacteria bacterium]|mgnify:CR=1 FL=1|nr:MAG: NAD-dependent epimerase/dehydratase family protein [Gammaproteobacteria bacterium]
MTKTHAVTGAYGYSGKYLARRLLAKGHRVITLTNSINRKNEFGDKVKAFPFNFDNYDKLVESLKGVDVLYNNYWVRFNHSLFNHSDAVKDGITLLKAAKDAGVKRIVHVSITNPSLDSDLEYFKGKAEFEKTIFDLDIPHSILRPTVLFGKEDILINNIAWSLRKLPFVGIFGDGEYKLQPIYVDDLAELMATHAEMTGNHIVDAIGPETFTYKELVNAVAYAIGIKKKISSMSPFLGYLGCRALGLIVGDMIITRDEIKGLMRNLLYVESPPAGKTRLTDWLKENADTVGIKYTSELKRRKNRNMEYDSN